MQEKQKQLTAHQAQNVQRRIDEIEEGISNLKRLLVAYEVGREVEGIERIGLNADLARAAMQRAKIWLIVARGGAIDKRKLPPDNVAQSTPTGGTPNGSD